MSRRTPERGKYDPTPFHGHTRYPQGHAVLRLPMAPLFRAELVVAISGTEPSVGAKHRHVSIVGLGPFGLELGKIVGAGGGTTGNSFVTTF